MVDQERFERTWRRHGASILRYCRFAGGSHEAGEDLAAETFARFLRKGEAVDDQRTEAWLFTVARNLCASHHRRSSRWNLLLPRLARSIDTVVDAQQPSELGEMLRPLAADDRLAVYLRVIEERSFAEVATIIGKSEQATKKTVYRALDRLRRAMTETTSPIVHRGGVEHE